MTIRSCPRCSAPIEGHGNRRYCSSACRLEERNSKASLQRAEQNADRLQEKATCPECEGEFTPWVPRSSGGYGRRKYCSPGCKSKSGARRAYRSEAGQARYRKSVEDGVFAAASRRSRARRRITEIIPCKHCGVDVERSKGSTKMLCGSAACAREDGLARCHLRNARLKGAETEPFNRLDVFERDGWVCRLCGDPVQRDAPPKSKWSASLDHVVPLARGGAHSYENTQCTHLWCNQKKSDNVDVRYIAVTGDRI